MPAVLDVAKITSKGQITIPASVRKEMGLGEGDRVLFVLEDDGRITLCGSNLQVLHAAQLALCYLNGLALVQDCRFMLCGRHIVALFYILRTRYDLHRLCFSYVYHTYYHMVGIGVRNYGKYFADYDIAYIASLLIITFDLRA